MPIIVFAALGGGCITAAAALWMYGAVTAILVAPLGGSLSGLAASLCLMKGSPRGNSTSTDHRDETTVMVGLLREISEQGARHDGPREKSGAASRAA